MPQACYRLVDPQTTPYYHCISRCVRRAFLCGLDRFSGKNFDHRKQWILDRIKQLSSIFAIDVCAYAIMSNEEDQCTGRFWEGRFRSQALLDEAALVSCMAYVDLNPIRAGMSESLEKSEFTSIQERLADYRSRAKAKHAETWRKPLLQEQQLACSATLPTQESSYFDLVDWTGHAIRDDKRGAIPIHVQPILQKLGVNETNWANNTQHFGSRFHRALGRINQIRKLADRMDRTRISGFASAKRFYQ